MAMQFWDPARGELFVVPADLADSGKYQYIRRPRLRTNGRGQAVTAQYDKVVWQWDFMPAEWWEWWTVTFMPSLASVYCNGVGGTTYIWSNQIGVLTAVSGCTVYQPTFQHYGNGDYVGVKVEISNILA